MIINKPGWNNQFNSINRHWYNRPNRPFRTGWWGGHVRHPIWHPWRRPGWGRWHWWAPVTVGAVTGWFVGSAWGDPCYYNYGTGGNVYYEGDTVYIEGDEYCSTTEYYQEAEQIATAVPEYTEHFAGDVVTLAGPRRAGVEDHRFMDDPEAGRFWFLELAVGAVEIPGLPAV